VALGVLIAVGVVVSIALTFARPLWLDEVLWIRESVESPYAQLILEYRSQDPNHPPLSFLLMKCSMDLARGDDPWVVRLIPLLAGIVCIPLAYLVGSRCHSAWLGLWGAAGAACSPLLIDQSAQAKDFSLVCLFNLLALLATVVVVRGRAQNWRHAGWLGLALGVGLWNSQMALVSWAAAAVALASVLAVDLFRGRGLLRRQLLTALIAAGVAVVVGLPGLLDIWRVRLHQGPASGGPGFAETVRELRLSLPVLGPPAWRWLGLAAALLGLAALLRREGLVAIPFIALIAFSLLFAYELRQHHSFFTERYLMPLLPSLWFGLGAFAVLPRRTAFRRALAAALVLVLGVQLAVSGARLIGWRQEYEYSIDGLVRSLGREVRPGDVVIFSPDFTDAFGWHARLPVVRGIPPCEDLPSGAAAWLLAVRVISAKEAAEARSDAVRLAHCYGHDPDAAWLDAHVGVGQSAAVRIDREGVSYYAATRGSWEPPATR
jgi:hypothetical protein